MLAFGRRAERVFIVFSFSMDRHEEELQFLFGSSGPTETLKSRVSSFLEEKRREVREVTANIQKLKQQQSSKQAEKRMTL